MSMKYGTICSKHESVIALASQVVDLVGQIEDLTDKCLDDGKNMEHGLDSKRQMIEQLQEEIKAKDATIAELERRVENLEFDLKEFETNTNT